MKQKDSNYLSMAAATLQALHANQAVWENQAMFSKIVAEIEADVNALTATIGDAGIKSNSVSAGKWAAAETAIGSAVKYSRLAQIHALEIDNNVLYGELNTTSSQLHRFSDQELVPALQHVFNKIDALKTELEPYGISATELARFQAEIDVFKENKDQPRVIIAKRKGFTSTIPVLLSEIKASFFKLDRLIKIWEETNDRFVTDYENARLVISRGTRKETSDTPPPLPPTID